ncbi:hypothetical protein [Raoultella ornithinolytica]|uniref:hypothetical protein n=1 Tax=Raoultella ornithinolytica TaxID=54291 RepID=UPI00366E6DB9
MDLDDFQEKGNSPSHRPFPPLNFTNSYSHSTHIGIISANEVYGWVGDKIISEWLVNKLHSKTVSPSSIDHHASLLMVAGARAG